MGKKVLIADDDPDVIMISAAALAENGFQAIKATNGEEAMNFIKSEKPDLIILDILMPRESGVRLYRNIKTDPVLKGTPVVIQSGIAEKSFMRSQKALTEFGGVPVPAPEGYLEKPVEPENLIRMIRKFLG